MELLQTAVQFLVVGLSLSVAAGFAANYFLASRGYRGVMSDHFDGTRFSSYGGEPVRHLPRKDRRMSLVKWLLSLQRGGWVWKENAFNSRPVARVDGNSIVVTFVNHATALIQVAGLNILTDPVWSRRVSPVPFFGPKRHRPPGIRFSDLPPIDAVLLSHNHYDHMDVRTLRKLAGKFNPKIFTGLGNTAYLSARRVSGARDLDWWDMAELSRDVTVTCVPSQHFSARALSDRNRTLWCGFVLDTPAGRIYFAGDTGYGEFAEHIAVHFDSFRLALLPIGAYKPAWFMSPVHMSPDEALAVHRKLHVATSLAIHFGTFRLAEDGQYEGAARLKKLISDLPQPRPDFRVLEHGETVTV